VETAVPLDIAAGMELSNVDVHLAKGRTVCVRFRAQRRIEGLRIVLSARHPLAPAWSYPASPLPEQGRYEACGILPGSYFAVASDRAGYSSRQPVDVDETGDQEFQLSLPPQSDVTGRITFEGEPPNKIPAVRVQLRAVERSSAGSPDAVLKDSRVFTISNVNPDRYLVAVSSLPEAFYVKAIRAGTADMLGKALEVFGSSPDPLEIVLSPNVGSVHGTVQDQRGGGPAPRAIIVLLPEEAERQPLEMFLSGAVADESGAFGIPNVAPGRYRAMAFEQIGEPGSLADPDFVAKLRAKGEALEVREKSPVITNLKLLPAFDVN
jgi:hypothetical protein